MCNPYQRHVSVVMAAFVWAHFGGTARSDEPIVVESALLRLIQQVDVPARAQGVLQSISVVEGDTVQIGHELAQVDKSEAELLHGRAAIELNVSKEKLQSDVAVRLAKNALEFSQSEHQRLQRAAQGMRGSISLSELAELKFRAEQAHMEMEKAEHERRLDELSVDLKNKELELAAHNVQIRTILAPINGVVVEVLKQPGEWVEPGDNVLRIVRMDRLRAEGMIQGADITTDLRDAHTSLTLHVPGRGETTFPGRVVFVSPEVNPVNGQVRVWAEVENREGLLRPGLRAKLSILPTGAPSLTESTSAASRP